jgi:hypothetical protein
LEKPEYKGTWWLPEKPSTIISGSLQFEANGRIVLQLLGALTDAKQPRPQSVPLILGKSTDGEPITLYGCIQTNTHFGIEGVRTSTFYVVGVLIGAHYEKPESIVFGSIAVTFPQLDVWIGVTGASVDFPNRHTLVITRNSSPIVTAVLRDAKISMGFQLAESIGIGEISVKYAPSITIEVTTEIQLKKLLDLLGHLRNFFALAACHPVYPESIDGFSETQKTVLTDGKSFRHPIKIVYHGVNWDVPHESVNMRGMLFELRDVRSEFETLMKNWFDKTQLLEPVFETYFGTMYNPGMYLHHKFLSLVQCVESYHRRAVRNCELPPDQAEKRTQEILESAPDVHKEWLKNKLRYSNEPTLRKRLQELLSSYPFLKFEDKDVEDVINTRNYLTHYDENLKALAANEQRLSELSMRLSALTEAILLTELGFSPDKVKSVMEHIGEIRSELHWYAF